METYNEIETLPSGFEDIGAIMSNFDHVIDDDAEEKLKAGGVYGGYAAWNFYAVVWYDKKFKAMIKQYRAHVNTIKGDSLQEIMDAASGLYGYE